MAHLHFKRTVYKSGGSAATQRLEYITRQPAHELSAAERQVRYIRDGREDLVYERSRNLPSWAHGNPHVYFQAAERHEGKNRVAFEEWKISLPQELSHRENMALTRDLVDTIAGEKLPVTYAFHDPTTMDGSKQQPHLHLLISARQTDTHTRTPAQYFKLYQAAHPERGGAQKDPAFWHRGAMKAHRVLIADVINLHLERGGHEARIHPDNLLARGIDRAPEPKLLPSESRQYREAGVSSGRMQQVLTIRADRQQSLAAEQVNARQYWLARKQELGIATRHMSTATKLERMREARAHAITHAPERPSLAQLREQEQALARSVEGLQHYVEQVQHAKAREAAWVPRQGRHGWEAMLDAERVLAAGKNHELPRDAEAEQTVEKLERFLAHLSREEEQSQGRALNIRLHETERDRGDGMGW
jgi:MobA/MobL family protein